MVAKLRAVVAKHRILAGLLGVTAGVPNLTSVAKWGTMPTRTGAALVLCLGIVYVLRWLTHLAFYTFADSTWRLRRLVATELLLAVSWLLASVRVLTSGSALELAFLCFALFVSVAVLAHAVLLAVAQTPLDTASVGMARTPLVGRVVGCLESLGLEDARELFGEVWPGLVSALVAAILLLLGALACANVAGACHEFSQQLDRWFAAPAAPADPAANATPASPHAAAGPARGLPSPAPKPTPTPARLAARTYEQICGRRPIASTAPKPVAQALRQVFLAAGQPASGCAGAAEPANDVTWVLPGFCGATVSSLAVAGPGMPPALLIGTQPGRTALLFARAGRLLYASPRIAIRSGDAYILGTDTGPLLMIRSASPSRPNVHAAPTCASVPFDAVRYVTLPPALARLWLGLARETFTWPRQTSRRYGVTRLEFRTDTRPGRLVATGRCDASGCTLTRRGGRSARRQAAVTAVALKDLR